jgi:hypothetical protein
MNKASIVVPLIAASLSVACTTTDDSDVEVGADVQISAAVQADLAGLSGLEIRLTPGKICDLYSNTDHGTPYGLDLDLTHMLYPDGTPFEGPTDYTHLLGETSFEGVIPGCYDVVAAPVGLGGEPLPSCLSTTVPIVVDAYTSQVIDIPVQCSAAPRTELDVPAKNNPPEILMITADPMVSACEATVVCATARDVDQDMLEFEWLRPDGIAPAISTRWPTIVSHTLNADASVTQCIAVQARSSGNYEIAVRVYDLYDANFGYRPARIEDRDYGESHARDSVTIDATLGCEALGRSAVIVMTLASGLGMPESDARTLIDNTVRWVAPTASASPSVLVVLDDNHRGRNHKDAEHIAASIEALGYPVDFIREPRGGLVFADIVDYDVVWFSNPSDAMDDPHTHTALLRYRALGGGLVLQGDDIARFRGNPGFMEPLTYLEWQGDGTIACGEKIKKNGESYTVSFAGSTATPHPISAGIEGLTFMYAGDIDLTVPLGKGEQVVAWASYTKGDCDVRTPAVVALEPDLLVAWD